MGVRLVRGHPGHYFSTGLRLEFEILRCDQIKRTAWRLYSMHEDHSMYLGDFKTRSAAWARAQELGKPIDSAGAS